MADDMYSSKEDNASPEAVEAKKKRALLNGVIVALIFLLSVVLPPRYKGFAPLLFLIPFILAVVSKVRQAGEKRGDSMSAQIPPPTLPDHNHSVEPYSYTPRDPKDPRRYKPIE